MNTSYRNLFALFVLMVYLESAMSYPSSYINEQRSFLRCQISPVSCKRSLSTLEENGNPSIINHRNDFQECISQNKPIWYCLKHAPTFPLDDMNQNN
ncbi:unnamed protein product [Adineta steineri]|uniref:Uncharacterized protein n=1 Tax=Adineta steineri TaxID=433720 RepID=A0A813MJD5_9BILA|nr:unnamed protein product [Adineta steineri]CAF0721400.1 unnamed protein product [Adineta steineri]CAF0727398.1 unnamed protein product [Adineta steineri]CAF0752133.1 unnamed protein product [Adineta steineri]CAF3493509.1 unnamed protein product [Adineta steineri]